MGNSESIVADGNIAATDASVPSVTNLVEANAEIQRLVDQTGFKVDQDGCYQVSPALTARDANTTLAVLRGILQQLKVLAPAPTAADNKEASSSREELLNAYRRSFVDAQHLGGVLYLRIVKRVPAAQKKKASFSAMQVLQRAFTMANRNASLSASIPSEVMLSIASGLSYATHVVAMTTPATDPEMRREYFSKALEYARLALSLASSIAPTCVAHAHLYLGDLLQSYVVPVELIPDALSDALGHYQRALDYFTRRNDIATWLNIHLAMAAIYIRDQLAGDLEEKLALSHGHLTVGLATAQRHGFLRTYADLQNNIATNHLQSHMNEPNLERRLALVEEAIERMQESLKADLAADEAPREAVTDTSQAPATFTSVGINASPGVRVGFTYSNLGVAMVMLAEALRLVGRVTDHRIFFRAALYQQRALAVHIAERHSPTTTLNNLTNALLPVPRAPFVAERALLFSQAANVCCHGSFLSVGGDITASPGRVALLAAGGAGMPAPCSPALLTAALRYWVDDSSEDSTTTATTTTKTSTSHTLPSTPRLVHCSASSYTYDIPNVGLLRLTPLSRQFPLQIDEELQFRLFLAAQSPSSSVTPVIPPRFSRQGDNLYVVIAHDPSEDSCNEDSDEGSLESDQEEEDDDEEEEEGNEDDEKVGEEGEEEGNEDDGKVGEEEGANGSKRQSHEVFVVGPRPPPMSQPMEAAKQFARHLRCDPGSHVVLASAIEVALRDEYKSVLNADGDATSASQRLLGSPLQVWTACMFEHPPASHHHVQVLSQATSSSDVIGLWAGALARLHAASASATVHVTPAIGNGSQFSPRNLPPAADDVTTPSTETPPPLFDTSTDIGTDDCPPSLTLVDSPVIYLPSGSTDNSASTKTIPPIVDFVETVTRFRNVWYTAHEPLLRRAPSKSPNGSFTAGDWLILAAPAALQRLSVEARESLLDSLRWGLSLQPTRATCGLIHGNPLPHAFTLSETDHTLCWGSLEDLHVGFYLYDISIVLFDAIYLLDEAEAAEFRTSFLAAYSAVSGQQINTELLERFLRLRRSVLLLYALYVLSFPDSFDDATQHACDQLVTTTSKSTELTVSVP